MRLVGWRRDLLATVLVLSSIWATPPADAQTPPALRIVVISGEAAVNIIQQRTATAPVVEVRDRNNQPVAGALVRFVIQGGRATFLSGSNASAVSVTTNAAGQAMAAGLTPTASGAIRIAATATFQGQTAATVTIAQTNVMTAAQAAAVSSASSGGGAAGGGAGAATGTAGAAGTAGTATAAGAAAAGAVATAGAPATAGAVATAGAAGTAGTAGAAAAAAGTAGTAGTGLSLTTIGIIGGAAAGGTIVAAKALTGGLKYSGSFGGTLAMNNGPIVSGLPGGCTRYETQTGTIKMDVTDNNGTITGEVDLDGNVTVSRGTCADIPGNSGADTFGGGTKNVNGTPNSIAFATSDANASGSSVYNYSFIGAFNGAEITGTLTINRALKPDGSGTIAYQVTLR